MFLGDLNVKSSDPVLNDFCNVYSLFRLVKEPTCLENPYNSLCIDLFLTNRPRSIQNTVTIETAISNFHEMVISVLNVFYKKKWTKNHSIQNFDNHLFQGELKSELLKIDLNNADLSEFTEMFLSIIDMHAPKSKCLYE